MACLAYCVPEFPLLRTQLSWDMVYGPPKPTECALQTLREDVKKTS